MKKIFILLLLWILLCGITKEKCYVKYVKEKYIWWNPNTNSECKIEEHHHPKIRGEYK